MARRDVPPRPRCRAYETLTACPVASRREGTILSGSPATVNEKSPMQMRGLPRGVYPAVSGGFRAVPQVRFADTR